MHSNYITESQLIKVIHHYHWYLQTDVNENNFMILTDNNPRKSHAIASFSIHDDTAGYSIYNSYCEIPKRLRQVVYDFTNTPDKYRKVHISKKDRIDAKRENEHEDHVDKLMAKHQKISPAWSNRIDKIEAIQTLSICGPKVYRDIIHRANLLRHYQ